MVTEVPTGPPVGVKPFTTGGGPTVKEVALVPVPAPVVTVIDPLVALAGTGNVIEVSLQLVALPAGTPLNATVLVP